MQRCMYEWIKEHDRDIGGFQELKLQPSLNMPVRPGIIHSGMRLSLLTNTLYWDSWSTHANSIQSLPQQTAVGTVSSSSNTNNALDWNPPTMSEVHDTPVTNNHVMVVQIVLLSKSTYCLADWDLQLFFFTLSKRRDQYLCDNCETNY